MRNGAKAGGRRNPQGREPSDIVNPGTAKVNPGQTTTTRQRRVSIRDENAGSLFGMLHDILTKLLEINLIISVEITLLHQLLNKGLIGSILLFVCLKHNGQLLAINLAIMVDIEVIEGKSQVLATVGGLLGQAG